LKWDGFRAIAETDRTDGLKLYSGNQNDFKRVLISLLRIANYSDASASWSDTATVAGIGSPLPNAGEGPGGEGDTSLLI
jgi:hypothetical protein